MTAPLKATFKTIGNWQNGLAVPLRDALAVSMDVIGRTGEEACKHAMILMAQSARALTKKAPKNRPVLRDSHLGPYVEVYHKGKRGASKSYRWNVEHKGEITWEQAKRIKNAGLAKRSWMWGLNRLGQDAGSREIPGASAFYVVNQPNLHGYVKENRLGYLSKPKVMEAGWESTVLMRAGNKIMAQARDKLERVWKRHVARGERSTGRTVASFFTRRAA